MTKNDELLQKRQEIRDEIKGGKYKSLAGIMLDGTGRFIQKLTFSRKAPAFWFNSLAFAILTLLICMLLSLLEEPASNLNLSAESTLMITVSGVLGILLGSSFVIAAASAHKKLMMTLQDTVLGVIESTENLNDLQSWLATTFSVRFQLLTSLLFPLLLFPINLYLRSEITGENLGIVVYLIALIAGFQAFTAFSVLSAIVTMPHRLSYYQIKLFAADPSSSEVIDNLSDTINNIIFIAAILMTIFTIIAFLGNPWIVAIYILFLPWLGIIIIFASGHRALARIVIQAKWRTLNSIQAQIEALQTRSEILDEETLNQINKLLDYYNRIKATQNSAVDMRAGLNLLQSLLLPLIGLLIANALDILNILSRLTVGK